MGPPVGIIGKVACQDTLHMLLVGDEHMLETLLTDTPDQALHIGVLPWRIGRSHDLLDAHIGLPGATEKIWDMFEWH
jgi:hypothetical protein